ncbi:hypothetical protein I4U23_017138 [Adineta vaga]|nr:hypothetical protein I4U23_017138 [Adineta vaga]
MAQQQPSTTATIADDELLAMYLESEELYMAHMNPISPTATARNSPTLPTLAPMNTNDADDNDSSGTVIEPYQIRTLGEHNLARASVLPVFPPVSLSSSALSTATTMTNIETLHLLLANVWIERLTDEQFHRIRHGTYLPLFELTMDAQVDTNQNILSTCVNNSYMWDFHRTVYVNTRKRLKIDTSIIDFNLKRLQQCIEKVTIQRGYGPTMLSFNEMSLALEFYLQTDGK